MDKKSPLSFSDTFRLSSTARAEARRKPINCGCCRLTCCQLTLIILVSKTQIFSSSEIKYIVWNNLRDALWLPSPSSSSPGTSSWGESKRKLLFCQFKEVSGQCFYKFVIFWTDKCFLKKFNRECSLLSINRRRLGGIKIISSRVMTSLEPCQNNILERMMRQKGEKSKLQKLCGKYTDFEFVEMTYLPF